MRPIIIDNDKMTGPEKNHAENLKMRKASGEIIDYIYEPFRLTLAKKTTYTPDFLIVFYDHFEIHEVKGARKDKKMGTYVPFCRGDESLTKLKICARLFPWWKFKLYWYKGKVFYVRDIVS